MLLQKIYKLFIVMLRAMNIRFFINILEKFIISLSTDLNDRDLTETQWFFDFIVFAYIG